MKIIEKIKDTWEMISILFEALKGEKKETDKFN